MSRILRTVLISFVALLALYGGIQLIGKLLTREQGELAGKVMHPFVSGMLSVAGEKAKESLSKTPDEQLEKDAELFMRKAYPITKGAIKGFADSLNSDPNKAEMQKQAYEAGKNISENVVNPFTKGILDGSQTLTQDLEKRASEIRNFAENNKEIGNIISGGLDILQKALKNLPPPPGPFRRLPNEQYPDMPRQ